MKDIELFNDHFQNYKTYGIPKAQLIIADIPYNIGKDAYGSNPSWYIGGDNANGESELAGKTFFDTDNNFRISEFLHFCSKMLIKEPKETFLIPNDRHCSYCIHYEPCPDFRMYCKALQRRITARKKPCKFYEIKQTHGTRTSR